MILNTCYVNKIRRNSEKTTLFGYVAYFYKERSMQKIYYRNLRSMLDR